MAKIYISGPITGNENYKKQFEEAEELIKSIHAEPVNPAKNPEGLTYKEYIDLGLNQLMGCDMIFLLPGHDRSRGACLEKAYARTVRMPIINLGYCSGKLTF